MAKIIQIEGVGPSYADKLRNLGIRTTTKLLDEAATMGGRQRISEETGIPEGVILEWAFLADLMTIDGIGPEYASLLEAAGVDTKPELALRSPQLLLERMRQVNERKHLVRRLPSQKQVAGWIKQALKSPSRIRYI